MPTNKNELLEKVLRSINGNIEVKTLWNVINVNAMDRLGMSDHGHVHFQIVANIALKFARTLHKDKVKMSLEKDYGLSYDHSEIVIFLASLLHDLGMTIDRKGHEGFSLFLANNILREMLAFMNKEEQVIITSEVLHAIISHRSDGKPLTVEAGIVRVADALDMSEGRTRVSYEKGIIDIYNISATAIDKVEIKEGKDKPISILITMNNSSGIFQVDELLKKKLKGSGIEDFVSIKAVIKGDEKSLVKEFEF
ncbi:HD domain-containing protein [Candidatus Woesebacteria bacterium]|nr:HD domain-containing protein [Candidatus Woesebacteria bacterium]